LLVRAIVIVAFATDATDGFVKSLAVTIRRVLALEIILIVVNFTFSMRSLSLVASVIYSVIKALQFNNFVD